MTLPFTKGFVAITDNTNNQVGLAAQFVKVYTLVVSLASWRRGTLVNWFKQRRALFVVAR